MLTRELVSPSTADRPVIDAHGISRRYSASAVALADASLQISAGEFAAVLGPSGAGKSTLLNILGLLDRPDSGTYRLAGEETIGAQESHLNRLRADVLGFVFQDAHVLPARRVTDNLELALAARRTSRHSRGRRIAAALDEVGLAHRADSAGRSLSGGERQRLAIARALVTDPAVVLADEPTGNLDDENSAVVMQLLQRAAARGAAVVMITHDKRHAAEVDRVFTFSAGTLTETR